MNKFNHQSRLADPQLLTLNTIFNLDTTTALQNLATPVHNQFDQLRSNTEEIRLFPPRKKVQVFFFISLHVKYLDSLYKIVLDN